MRRPVHFIHGLAAVTLSCVLAGCAGATNASDVAASEAGDATADSTSEVAESRDDAQDDAIFLAAYDATIHTEQAQDVRLTALGDGKPLVLNFWATWCPYCVQELPDFKALVEEYDGRVSFAFIDVGEDVDVASAWLAENGFQSLPAYYDTESEAARVFGTYSLPTTAIIGADGQILSVAPGRINADGMRRALDSLLV